VNTISLKDILQTVEGDYFFSRCLSPQTPCNRNETNCKVQRVFAKITADVSHTLEQTTIDQLM
ncbi:MAG: Rrf2 family transcriptional regulator, partial [Oscillospiraceae bacterium]